MSRNCCKVYKVETCLIAAEAECCVFIGERVEKSCWIQLLNRDNKRYTIFKH